MSAAPLMLATLDGFAVEGGFDVAYGPTTNYCAASSLALCSSPGAAAGLWDHYESAIELVPSLGLDGIRLSLEWARLEPRQARFDGAATARYRRAIEHARSLGLRVTGVVVDSAWPAWLGQEAWLLPWVGPEVVRHVARVMSELGDVLSALVVFARRDAMIEAGFVTGTAPPWRDGALIDAATAKAKLVVVEDEVQKLPGSADWLFPSFVEVPVLSSATAFSDVLASVRVVDEIHLRSLVSGAGPTAVSTSLLEGHDDQWRVAVSDSVSRLLTQGVGGSSG